MRVLRLVVPGITAFFACLLCVAEEPASVPCPTPESFQLPSGQVVHLGRSEVIEVSRKAGGEGRQVNVAFILDASGSMNAVLPATGKTRLEVAKQVLETLFAEIPADLRGTLWIYGHRRPKRPQSESCRDIEQAIPLGPVDAEVYVTKIRSINAIGYTPITASLKQAAAGLPENEKAYNTVILVSDGYAKDG